MSPTSVAEPGARRHAAPAVTRAAALPLGIALIVLFFTYWCVDIVSPALPSIQESLSLSATGAGLIFSVFFAGRLVTNLPAAWLVERAGPRWTAAAGAAALLAGSILAAAAPSQLVLLPARGIQGAGVAFLATAGLLSVLRALPGDGSAMTAFNVASGIGGSVGLLVGGYLAAGPGWRTIFMLAALVSGFLLVLIPVIRDKTGLAHPTRPDSAGLDTTSLRPGSETAAIAANFLVFANYAIWVVSLPLLGAVKFGLDAGQVGLVLLFVNLVHLACAVPVGRVIRKAGAPRALAAGFGAVGLGLIAATYAPSLPWLAVPMTLYAIGQVAGNSSAGDLILRLGGGGGRAVGAVRLSSDVGLVVGPAAAGAIADAAGVEASFTVLGLLALMTMGAMLAVFRGRRA